jgi:hypothetical protein
MSSKKRNIRVLLHAPSFQSVETEVIEHALTALGCAAKDFSFCALHGSAPAKLKKQYDCRALSGLQFPKIIAESEALRTLIYAYFCEDFSEYDGFIILDGMNYFQGEPRPFYDERLYEEGDATLFHYQKAGVDGASYFLQPPKVQRTASFLAKAFDLDDEDEIIKRFHFHECKLHLFYISRIGAARFLERLHEIIVNLGRKKTANLPDPAILFASELFHAGVWLHNADNAFLGFFGDLRQPYRKAALQSAKLRQGIVNAVFHPVIQSPVAVTERVSALKDTVQSTSALRALLRSLSNPAEYQAFGKAVKKNIAAGQKGSRS